MINIDEYKRKRKIKDNPKDGNNFLRKLSIKVLISLILFLCFLIGIKKIEDFDKLIYENIFNSHISFAKINAIYNSYFGDLFPIKNIENDVLVFNDSLVYSNKEDYLDGVLLTVNDDYLVPIIMDGIIVFVGEKEKYGKTIIIEDEEGVDIW